MLIDGRLLPYGTRLRADVVVVGAGPAGIACAERLADRGLHVALVEAAGREHDDDDFLDGDGSGEPFPLVRSRHRGFGGTSTHWTPATGLRVRRLDRIDFVARPGRPVDPWPLTAEELEPYYVQAYRLIGLDPDDSMARWYGTDQPSPLTWPGGPQLAMYQFAPYDTFTRRFDEVRARRNVDLVLHGTIDELVTDDVSGAVTEVGAVCPGGNRFRIVAEHVVLACGAIENARVLLSSPGPSGRGVGNEHDNVGRYFMDHLSVDTGILEPLGDTAIDALVFREHARDGHRYQPMLWLGNELIERAELPNAAFWINDLDALYLSHGVGAARRWRAARAGRPKGPTWRAALAAARHAPDLAGFAAHRAGLGRGRRVLAMRILIEQVPDRASRVTLSDRRDPLGRRRVHVDWRIARDDLEAIRRHQDLLSEHLEQRGVARIVDRFDPDRHPSPIMSNYHHVGTARMHDNPRLGVVDATCRVHSSPNLYVVGGSAFTSGGYLNPTLTIIALGLRVGDTIADRAAPTAVTTSRSDAPGDQAPGV
jgi:choline dehydrogenase-like flavoprotein